MGGGSGEFNGYRVLVRDYEKVLQMDNSDGCTTT